MSVCMLAAVRADSAIKANIPSLVCFIDYNHTILAEREIIFDFFQQHTVSHELNECLGRCCIVISNLERLGFDNSHYAQEMHTPGMKLATTSC